jgi:hypothetical protein
MEIRHCIGPTGSIDLTETPVGRRWGNTPRGSDGGIQERGGVRHILFETKEVADRDGYLFNSNRRKPRADYAA